MVLAGLLALWSVQARADEASNKDTIVQGVRDDVRRKIQESGEKPSGKSEELASRAKQQLPASAPASSKQEPAK
jgi:hypothetical protein